MFKTLIIVSKSIGRRRPSSLLKHIEVCRHKKHSSAGFLTAELFALIRHLVFQEAGPWLLDVVCHTRLFSIHFAYTALASLFPLAFACALEVKKDCV